jgi:hypothetical protein
MLVYHCCTILYTSVWFVQLILSLEHLYTLHCVLAEPESEIQEEKVQEGRVVHKCQVVWVLTLFVSKVSPGASHQLSLVFSLITTCVKYVCALSLQGLIDALVALGVLPNLCLSSPL